MTITGKDEGNYLLWKIGARASDCTRADKHVERKGFKVARLPAVRMIDGDDEQIGF
ncbi:MAG TPA: hypothetical protein VNU92_06950 [Edaphobacter sp.]|nr:hypothetical protein [Edaphobacter sp.]